MTDKELEKSIEDQKRVKRKYQKRVHTPGFSTNLGTVNT